MKKYIFTISVLIFCISIFIPTKVKANEYGDDWKEQLVDIFKVSMGLNGIGSGQNAQLNGLSTSDFYSMLYNTQLTWNDFKGNPEGTITFTPSDTFTEREWQQLCTTGTYDDDSGGPHSTNWAGFNIADCFIDSGFVTDNGDSITINKAPTLSDATNAEYPLDGVEVITNFGSFSPDFSNLKLPYLARQMVDDTKQSFNGHNYIIIAGYASGNQNASTFEYYRYNYIAYDNTNYVYILKSWENQEVANIYSVRARYNNAFNANTSYSTWLLFPTINSSNRVNGYGNASSLQAPFISGTITFNDSNVGQNSPNQSYLQVIYNAQFYSNQPVVLASTNLAGQNYYYWKNQIPFGNYYTSNNITNITIPKTTINNTNWSETYNNYITDVSNYYTTTENIDNSQLIEYITQQTTYTNIVNNYIVQNNSGGGGESVPDTESGGGSGGSGEVIDTSWLQRIYQKICDIEEILLGRTDGWLTSNGLLNGLGDINVPDLFPDVPADAFLDKADDFTIGLFSEKIAEALMEAVPFGFLYALANIAETLEAQPEAPYFEIPFTIERLGVDEDIVIDLTSDAWEIVHGVWITCFMILIIWFLAYVTYKTIMLVSNIFV